MAVAPDQVAPGWQDVGWHQIESLLLGFSQVMVSDDEPEDSKPALDSVVASGDAAED